MSAQNPIVSSIRPLQKSYDGLVASGELESDDTQIALIARLDDLLTELGADRLASKQSSLGWLFGKSRKQPEPTKGLYIWGSVGRGKTMLMDLFFHAAPHTRKRRVHFHDFMRDAHNRIHNHRQAYKAGEVKEEDPVPPVARALAADARLLCFDEFTVTDIADAMILSRLFTVLFEEGVVVVATSNVDPDLLYKDGINRGHFLPFVELLKTRVDVLTLDAPKDYRREKMEAGAVYFSPLGEGTTAIIEDLWANWTDKAPIQSRNIEVKGRTLTVSPAYKGFGRFSFDQLCRTALGAGDYLAITEHFHSIFLDGVPLLDATKRNEAKRFIILIDTIYDSGRRLVVSADGQPFDIYQAKSGTEAFEFDRTVSRLTEMRSNDYLKQWQNRSDSGDFDSLS